MMIVKENSDFEVLINDKHLYIAKKTNTGEVIEVVNKEMDSIMRLSETLRDNIGLLSAMEMLQENKVPKNLAYWYLGRNAWING